MGLIHSTLENYRKLVLEVAKEIFIIKAISLLTGGELMPKKVKQPIEGPKRKLVRSLEFFITK